jgi:threonyl-tRNA synthetase
LTRVRRFQQDDAHIFCRQDQIGQEMTNCLNFLQHVYGILGFNFTLKLSTRPDNHLGEVSVWEKAEARLAESLNEFGHPWTVDPGDGAFYGPKIDITVSDALRRKHQCATIQLDFQLPERFGLEFHSADTSGQEGGSFQRPVIIHRAILGSVERLMAILCEHYGGKWPFWLSPRQIVVVPVAGPFYAYAESIRQKLFDAGFYADADLSDNTLNKKIRNGEVGQYNFILVVGAEEESTNTVNVRCRDDVGTKAKGETQSFDTVLAKFLALKADKRLESKI